MPRRGIEHREIARAIGQKLAPIEIRIDAGGMRHFIDKALFVERVLGVVDGAPDAERHRRRPHDVVHPVVRYRVRHFIGKAGDKSTVDDIGAEFGQ